MKHPLPDAALAAHIAYLGKTGSGKTTSAKGTVEHIVRRDPNARVCVLDPIKSDWWGMTSSADGTHAGLPFHILGGPRGHVPLHESAGAAIGELVGSGALPLSIIDMADFGPGGLQRFFNDFAPALLRKVRGVVHLVLEEAHEFAPKERAGIGNENMTVYFAKKLATAGRSKGVRIMVVTQRTQQLHNALLGSCETMVAHRLTLPADQVPVTAWLKGHVDKPTFDKVAGSLASLRTGTAWLCSGEAQLAELVEFPRLRTFDNSATPDGSAEVDVKTAPVDREKLRAIMGNAVKEAEANDPATLRKRIRELEAEVARKPAAAVDPAAVEQARREGYSAGVDTTWNFLWQHIATHGDKLRAALDGLTRLPEADKPAPRPAPSTGIVHRQQPYMPAPVERAVLRDSMRAAERAAIGGGFGAVALPKAERLILTVLAQRHPERVPVERVAAIAGYAVAGGGFNNALSSLRGKALIEPGPSPLAITAGGLDALGSFDPLPTGHELLVYWMGRVGKAERAILDALSHGTNSKERIAEIAGYAPDGGGFNNALSRLRTLGLITGRGTIELHEDLR